MGNCLRHESPMEWGGEDWGSLTAAADHRRSEMSKKGMKTVDIEEEEDHTSSSQSRGNNSTEVKIKITKRQLEELLGKVDVKGISVQQMLAELASVSSGCRTHQSRSWQPALQSIPEIN